MPGLSQADKQKVKVEVKRRVEALVDEEGDDVIPYIPHGEIELQKDEYGSLFTNLEDPIDEDLTSITMPIQDNLTATDAQLKLYWDSPHIDRTSTVNNKTYLNNPLSWWASNQMRFPCVAKLARRILSIPATSAPSERLFSDAGITIAKDRACLLPDTASTVVFLQDAWDKAEKYIEENM
jgi:hypothetical protein